MKQSAYKTGLDVLGEGTDVASFIPWLGIVGKVVETAGASSGKKDDKGKGGAAAAGGLGGLAAGLTGGGAKGGSKPSAPSGPSPQQLVKQAMAEERARQEAEKMKADAAKTRLILYSVLGIVGVGGVGLAAWAIFRR